MAWEAFSRQSDFLVCVDSDGCVMDSMEWKHRECFGPELVRAYRLESLEAQVLELWNRVNLYSGTRGCNRFLAAVLVLDELSESGLYTRDYGAFKAWAQSADELSNPSLRAAIQENEAPALATAYAWSLAVNEGIRGAGYGARPFENAGAALVLAAQCADVVVVSSANRGAVVEEWTEAGFMPHVRLLCTQEYGSKADCIAKLLTYGYAPERVLMVGDAPGDAKAADSNGVWFYPVLPGREAGSWRDMPSAGLEPLLAGSFAAGQAALLEAFAAAL